MIPLDNGEGGWVPRSLRSGQQSTLASGRDDKFLHV